MDDTVRGIENLTIEACSICHGLNLELMRAKDSVRCGSRPLSLLVEAAASCTVCNVLLEGLQTWATILDVKDELEQSAEPDISISLEGSHYIAVEVFNKAHDMTTISLDFYNHHGTYVFVHLYIRSVLIPCRQEWAMD